MTSETPICDAFIKGVVDARRAAAKMSPADIREQLDMIKAFNMEVPYIRGYVTELRNARPNVRRGQGGPCTGLLTVRLEGPSGCGKSLVAGILRGLLPLLPLDRFVVEEHIL